MAVNDSTKSGCVGSRSNLPDPYYATELGAAYLGDAFELMKGLRDCSVNLVMTSPPFALNRKKEYGNVSPGEYVSWFKPIAAEIWRVLTKDGSLVIHIGGSWEKGRPTRSLYHLELLFNLCRNGDRSFYLAQDLYWFNPARLPSPAQWVTVKRVRVKDAVDPVWWLSKGTEPKADNRRVIEPYSRAMRKLLERGYNAGARPSGHVISEKFQRYNGGAIPPNLLVIANTQSNGPYLRLCRQANIKPHPARYPVELPQFFIKLLTVEGDVVLDPFAGSNATGESAEILGRRWIAFEQSETYLRASRFRFQQPPCNP
ncbi:MAG: site-specific DNA-methyltransferase [Chloroflexota bacterium]